MTWSRTIVAQNKRHKTFFRRHLHGDDTNVLKEWKVRLALKEKFYSYMYISEQTLWSKQVHVLQSMDTQLCSMILINLSNFIQKEESKRKKYLKVNLNAIYFLP